MFTIYFTDCALSFVPASDFVQREGRVIAETELTRAKVIKFFESCNTLIVPCSDVESAFERFASQFKWIEAAGGVVVNPKDEYLMIFRRGRWDLPKGHIDAGEDAATAALREVEEETGVKGAKIVAPLCNTLHAYGVYGEWELKKTYWFKMECQTEDTVPQSDEDIEAAVWCNRDKLRENLTNSYPTIIDVINSLDR